MVDNEFAVKRDKVSRLSIHASAREATLGVLYLGAIENAYFRIQRLSGCIKMKTPASC